MPDKGTRARATITETARRLFYHKGYGATSYADIAEVTGYGKGNIHYYFKAKEDILHAVTTARLRDFQTTLTGWENDCATPFACLDRFIDMFAENGENLASFGCPMGTLTGELGKDGGGLQPEARQMIDLFMAWLEAQFGRVMPADQAKKHAEHLMVQAQGISALTHAFRDAGLVRRQTEITRRWLADVMGQGQMARQGVSDLD